MSEKARTDREANHNRELCPRDNNGDNISQLEGEKEVNHNTKKVNTSLHDGKSMVQYHNTAQYKHNDAISFQANNKPTSGERSMVIPDPTQPTTVSDTKMRNFHQSTQKIISSHNSKNSNNEILGDQYERVKRKRRGTDVINNTVQSNKRLRTTPKPSTSTQEKQIQRIELQEQQNENSNSKILTINTTAPHHERTYTHEEVEAILAERSQSEGLNPRTIPLKVTLPRIEQENKQLTVIFKVQYPSKMPEFRGEETGVEPFCAALAAKKHELTNQGELNPDGELLGRVSESMVTNEAQMWYNSELTKAGFTSVADLCSRLREFYHRTINLLEQDRTLMSTYQQPTETVQQFALGLECKATGMGVDLENLMVTKAFMNGLANQKIQQGVALFKHKKSGATWRELVEEAKRLQNRCYTPTAPTNYKPPMAPAFNQPQQQEEEEEEEENLTPMMDSSQFEERLDKLLTK